MQLVMFWMACFTLHPHRVTVYSAMEEYIATMEEHNRNKVLMPVKLKSCGLSILSFYDYFFHCMHSSTAKPHMHAVLDMVVQCLYVTKQASGFFSHSDGTVSLHVITM